VRSSHQLHGAIEETLVLAVLVDGAYVLVPHLAREGDLVMEASHRRRVLLHAQHLEGHHDVQGAVAGAEDGTHAALAQRRLDLVAIGDDPTRGNGERLAAGRAAARGRIRGGLARGARHGRTPYALP